MIGMRMACWARLSPTTSPLPSGVQVGEPTPTERHVEDATLAPSGVSILNVPLPLGSEEALRGRGGGPHGQPRPVRRELKAGNTPQAKIEQQSGRRAELPWSRRHWFPSDWR